MYKAFISYTWADKKCAEKLERELTLLAVSRGEKDFKIFRDSTYSRIGENVGEGLKRNLEESEWLIVICSPQVNQENKKFNWVNFECDYFSRVLNRKNKIICFISDQAPLSGEIASFYPAAIRELSTDLAGDGRIREEWFFNVARVYCSIMGEDIRDIQIILQENSYVENMYRSHNLYQNGNIEEAVTAIKDIPYFSGVKGLEWYLLYALERKTAKGEFLGELRGINSGQIICTDRHNQYLGICDERLFMLVDYRTLGILKSWKLHDGKRFRAIRNNNPELFVTVGEGAVLKYWRYCGGEIQCLLAVRLNVKYKDPQRAIIYKNFDPNGIKGTNAACVNFCINTCAVITGDVVTLVSLQDGGVRLLDVPYKPVLDGNQMYWYWISFSEDGRFLFISNGKRIVAWSLAEDIPSVTWLTSAGQERPEHVSEPVYEAYWKARNTSSEAGRLSLEKGALWNRNFVSEYPVQGQMRYVGESKFLLSEEKDTWILMDLAESKTEGADFSERLTYLPNVSRLNVLENVKTSGGLMVVSGKWIVISDADKETLYLFTNQGQYVRKQVICDRKTVTPLSEQELKMPEIYSSMLYDYVNKIKNPEVFHAEKLGFLEENCMVVSCNKNKMFLWNLAGEAEDWKEISQEGQKISEEKQDKIDKMFQENGFVTSYITLDERRMVSCQDDTLSFENIPDKKVMLHLKFQHAVKEFYFSENERMLFIKGDGKIFGYEIPFVPDQNDDFLEELLRKRRERAQAPAIAGND